MEPKDRETEITGFVPMEPEQLEHVILNRIQGHTIEKFGTYMASSDGCRRLVIRMAHGGGLMIAPVGKDLRITYILDLVTPPEAQSE